ncbi:4-coumarate--CoA ligase-like 7, partial [Favolaschia claudopus]
HNFWISLFSFAYGLRTHPNTKPLAKRGSTVLIYSPNLLAWPVVLLGCSELVITTEDGIKTIREMFAKLGITKEEGDKRIIVIGRGLQWAGGPSAKPSAEAAGLLTMEALLNGGKLKEEENFDGPLIHETAFICYSSGTTGSPSELSMFEDVMLAILPFYHIYGAFKPTRPLPVINGLTVAIQTRFEPDAFCANIERYKVTHSLIVPPVLVALARHPAADKYKMTTLRYLCSGAAPLGKDLVSQVNNRLRKHGVRCDIVQGYGLTETSPTTHLLPHTEAERMMGSIGYLMPNLEARLVVDDDGKVDAEEGGAGELWIRGPSVMKGYLNNPTATANAITPDKWFRTGDVGQVDKEGFWYIVDRRKELIKYKPKWIVPPAELESILLGHPDIADCAVIGIDDPEQATELPRAYVVTAHPEKLTIAKDKAIFEQSVVKWMQSKVARHKYLRGGVRVIDIIPKSAAGKILRRELRDLAKNEKAGGQQLRTKL